MMMSTCPRCREPLSPDAEDAAMLRCAACSGAFVAAAEIGRESVNEPTSSEACAAAAALPGGASVALSCPGCGQPMLSFRLGEATLDRCESCGGVWLDSGEMLATAPAAETPASEAARSSRYLLYSLTLPERVVRSTVGVAAGTVTEAARYLVPRSFQNSKTYEIAIKNSLKFLAEDVGGVAGQAGEQAVGTDFAARKAVGNFLDMAGWATLGLSPVWLMAIASDVAYGTKSYLFELAGELKKEGLIDEDSTISSVDDLLDAVQNAAGRTAGLVDAPPLSVAELRKSLEETRAAIASADIRRVLPEAELRSYWQEMREIAAREDVSLIGVSGALTMHALGKLKTISHGTLTSVRVVGGLVNRHVVGHYLESMSEVKDRGFYETVRESATPYIEAVWNNFAADRETWTEQVVTGRAFSRAWQTIGGWLRRPKDVPVESPSETGRATPELPTRPS